MAVPDPLAIATRNTHKLREIARICPDWPTSWRTIATHPDDDWPDVEETGATYLDNALLKARATATALGIAAIADDSGIEVDALGGEPGPRSARYAGQDATDPDNLRQLLRAIKGVPSSGRTARYRCVAAVAWPDGREVHAEGTCEGLLATRPAGDGGFGYDPIFVPAGWDRTMAELTDPEKDRISHRGLAFRALKDLLTASE
ncbi:MAG: RdgB/HAM1 family non-canonical purine NTP pyrophosphatase [Actinomycetota bacterium]